MRDITIAVDAMGGDFGPQITVPAVVQALLYYPTLKIQLFGDRSAIQRELNSVPKELLLRLTVCHTKYHIANDDQPSSVLKKNLDTGMLLALQHVSLGKVDAAVSAGNTGALMALARSQLKMLPQVKRPALISSFPNQLNRSWLLDIGANIGCDSKMLTQFALMGVCLAESELNGKAKVALLNIGKESNKGLPEIKATAESLEIVFQDQFIGYVEPSELFSTEANVIVCDGFIGNICLKSLEGVANEVTSAFQNSLPSVRICRWVYEKVFSKLKHNIQQLDPARHNGASLLGLNGIVVKSHGNADSVAFYYAIEQALNEVQRQIPTKIRARLEAVLLERHQ
ncbi:phosphate acyltransferase PlsX [Vibrio sp.]|nr:phosphate acyltransferase PlsX [Vibrio sp.]